MGDETWEIEIAGENVADKIEIVGEGRSKSPPVIE